MLKTRPSEVCTLWPLALHVLKRSAHFTSCARSGRRYDGARGLLSPWSWPRPPGHGGGSSIDLRAAEESAGPAVAYHRSTAQGPGRPAAGAASAAARLPPVVASARGSRLRTERDSDVPYNGLPGLIVAEEEAACITETRNGSQAACPARRVDEYRCAPLVVTGRPAKSSTRPDYTASLPNGPFKFG